MKSYGVTIQLKATEQYFPVVVESLSNDDVHLFTVTTGLRRENAQFHLFVDDVNTTQRLSFSFPELSFDRVF